MLVSKFTQFTGVEILCLSTKFPHLEIRWNYLFDYSARTIPVSPVTKNVGFTKTGCVPTLLKDFFSFQSTILYADCGKLMKFLGTYKKRYLRRKSKSPTSCKFILGIFNISIVYLFLQRLYDFFRNFNYWEIKCIGTRFLLFHIFLN